MLCDSIHEASPKAEREPREVDVRRSVLIVDDDFDQRQILIHRFRKQGFEVLSAEDGRSALQAARGSNPGLILLDIEMPGMDGLSVCRELKDDPATWLIPVIILSASERENVVRLSRSAGCTYFVRKPYDPNALLLLAESAIASEEAW